ncbi:MAG: hypothetical protein ACE14P_14945 [Methanotrichaceae archaeon]
MEGLTDAMRQYGKTVDEIVKKNPKHGKEHGVKLPESANIIAVVAGFFTISVIITELVR